MISNIAFFVCSENISHPIIYLLFSHPIPCSVCHGHFPSTCHLSKSIFLNGSVLTLLANAFAMVAHTQFQTKLNGSEAPCSPPQESLTMKYEMQQFTFDFLGVCGMGCLF